MTIRTSVIKKLMQIVGSTNVLTDIEDLYVYSFEHIFREQHYAPVDAVVRAQSTKETEKVRQLADEKSFIVIQRGSVEPVKVRSNPTGAILLDNVAPRDLKPSEAESEEEPVTQDIKEVDVVRYGTLRNIALALKTLFLSKPAHKCQECTTCSSYCTVAPSFNNIETWSSKGRILLMRGLASGELDLSKKLVDVLYTCSTCGLCFTQCFQDLTVHEAITATRHHIAEKGQAPELFQTAAKNISEVGDPSGMPVNRRLSWTKGVSKLSFPNEAEILYWVGCMVATRTPNTAKAVANVLTQAKVDFMTLGEKEGCCGYVLLKTGLWNEARETAVKLVERVERTKADTLVTSCAGCYYTFRKLYPEILDIEMPCEVLHTSQLAEQLIHDQALELKSLNVKLTYHDPCSLGRHCDIYEPPRNILKAVPNLEFVETPLNRSHARCCGAGGGLWSFNNRVSMNSAFVRLANDVVPLGVDALATACPACHMNFRFTSIKKSLSVKIYDIMEIIEMALRKE